MTMNEKINASEKIKEAREFSFDEGVDERGLEKTSTLLIDAKKEESAKGLHSAEFQEIKEEAEVRVSTGEEEEATKVSEAMTS